MKKFICAISGLLLFSSDPGAAQRGAADVERNVAVELEKHPSWGVECSRAVAKYYPAQKGGEKAVFEFRVQMNGDDIRYNSYQASQNGLNVGGVCLQENGETGVWAIVIDDSDPKGRAKAIGYEISKAAELVAGMPPGAKVGVYSLARELKLLGASAGENNGWRSAVGIPGPVVVPGRGEESVKSVLACFPELNNKKVLNSSPRNNTNLWSGLLTLVERELPNQLTGGFAHLSANIVLLSDGVDESGRSGDMEKLARAAASAGVRIHTIAYPHKDSPNNEKALLKPDFYLGYHSLSDLSRMTKGIYCATGYDENGKEGIVLVAEAAWKNILPQGKIRLLELSVPYGEIYENRAFKLQLFNGKEKVCSFSIPSNEMARVIGAVMIRRLKTTSDFLKNKPLLDKDGVKPADFIELGQSLQKLCVLDGVEGILEEAAEDKGFKERLGKIISHAKAHPELMKEPADSFLEELGRFLCYGNPPLSSPAANAQAKPTVVNVNAPASGTETEEEENDREVVLDWVWWCLGGGGVALCLLGFWCVVRLMGRAPQAPAVTVLTGEADLSGPTQPVLASLVNMGNRSQSWVVCKTPCSVGRHSRNDVSLPFTYVSGTQFFLSRDAAGQWELKDANSTNGTMVNGRKVSSCPLNSGDVIRVADLELEFKVR